MFLSAPLASAQAIISTYAGSGRTIQPGLATNAILDQVDGLATDSAGNVYAAVSLNNVVIKVTPAGVLSVVAGNGAPGFSGDGGTATAATLNDPRGVAVDAKGNLYIVDGNNARVRKVDPSGIITTFAGSGSPNSYNFGGDGGPATQASLSDPAGLAVDRAGNVYIADGLNNRVRKVDTAGTITSVAGNGQSQFSGDGGPATSAGLAQPTGLAFDADGNLYIADTGNQRVRMVDAGGTITTIAGGGGQGCLQQGSAIGDVFMLPRQLVIDGKGNVLVADQWCNAVRKITQDGTISTVAGSLQGFSGDGGPAISASLYFPWGVALDSNGNVYIGDTLNQRIRKVDAGGIITTFAGSGLTNFSGDGGLATSAGLDYPYAVALDQAGNLYVADSNNNRVRKVTGAGTISTFAGTGTAGYSGDGGPATQAELDSPEGVAVDSAGNVYIADQNNQSVRRVAANGTITTYAGNGTGQVGHSGDGGPAIQATLNFPQGLAVDAGGNLYIADRQNNRVRRVAPSGVITTVAGNGNGAFSGDGGAAVNASLSQPTGVAVDSAGNLYIADWNNYRVRKVDTHGAITTIAGTGAGNYAGQEGVPATQIPMDQPVGVTVDGAGNLYITVTGSGTVTRVDPNGLGTRLVNETTYEGFGGDGGPALLSYLNEPWNLVADANGNLYIADSANDRIRKVTNVNSQQEMALSQHYFGFTVTAGQDGGSRASNIMNLGTGTLNWSATVQTNDGSNWFTLSPSSGTAPSTLTVTSHLTTLLPGTDTATITISAPGVSNSPQFITVPLYVGPTNGPIINSVVNGATFQNGVVPGSWVTITGSNLSGVTRTWNAADFTNGSALPTNLSGVEVTFGGTPAAVYYVSPTQLNVQAPANTIGNNVPVLTQYLGATSNNAPTGVGPVAPGLFTYQAGSNLFPAAVYNGTTVLVGDPAISGNAVRKALPGDIIEIYATGLGPSPSGTTIATPIPFQGTVAATMGPQNAIVLGAALVAPGEFQINVVVPDLPAGNYPLTISVGSQSSQSGVTIPVN